MKYEPGIPRRPSPRTRTKPTPPARRRPAAPQPPTPLPPPQGHCHTTTGRHPATTTATVTKDRPGNSMDPEPVNVASLVVPLSTRAVQEPHDTLRYTYTARRQSVNEERNHKTALPTRPNRQRPPPQHPFNLKLMVPALVPPRILTIASVGGARTPFANAEGPTVPVWHSPIGPSRERTQGHLSQSSCHAQNPPRDPNPDPRPRPVPGYNPPASSTPAGLCTLWIIHPHRDAKLLTLNRAEGAQP